jgi:hypothetical protein
MNRHDVADGTSTSLEPQPGIWKLRLYPKGWPYVPCRIILHEGLWSAEIDGQLAGLPDADPYKADGVSRIWESRKEPISEAEYEYRLTTLKNYYRKVYPEHPCLDPRKPVNPAVLRLTPEFGAPEAPKELAPEPLRENVPSRPQPLEPKEVIEWLNYTEEALTRDIKADIEQLGKDAKTTSLDTEEQVGRVGGNVDTAKAHLKLAEKHRKETKEPFLRGGQTVDRWFSRATLALTTALEPVQKLLNDYAARMDAIHRAEQERLAALKQAEADLLAEQAAAALRRSSAAAPALLEDATDAQKAAEAAEALAAGSAADLVRATTVYGRGMSAQESWDFGIADISQVPLQYLVVDEVKVRKFIKEYARDDVVAAREDAQHHRSPIPGIKVVRNIEMRNR